jgi:hypothetical protein
VLGLNLKGLFFTSQAVGRYWIEAHRFAPEHDRGKGKIVNVGSIGEASELVSLVFRPGVPSRPADDIDGDGRISGT